MGKKIIAAVLITILAAPQLAYAASRIRLKQYEVERTDQDLSQGNRGYIYGTPPPAPERTEVPKRTMLNLEIELPPYPEWDEQRQKKAPVKKEEAGGEPGNRGYVVGGETVQEEAIVQKEITQEGIGKEAPIIKKEEKEKAELPKTYKVKKGETLQSIAARPEIYNDWSKWTKLYKANKDKIENPNKIYPGQVIVIPREE